MHAFALPFDPPWKERKYSSHPWARFAFKPAEELVKELEAAAAAEGQDGADGDKTSRL